jgi:hypothetical protein
MLHVNATIDSLNSYLVKRLVTMALGVEEVTGAYTNAPLPLFNGVVHTFRPFTSKVPPCIADKLGIQAGIEYRIMQAQPQGLPVDNSIPHR